MNSRSHRSTSLRLLLVGALLLPGACKSGETPQSPSTTPPPAPSQTGRKAEISNDFTATAEVVALSPAERGLTVRRQDGTLLEIQCRESVVNYPQIKVGDSLRLRYRETLTAEVRPAGESASAPKGTVAAAKAPTGAKPGIGMGMAVSLRVKIESIDLKGEVVVFSLDSGELIARHVKTPQGSEFIKGLKVGDTVKLDYVEVVALDIAEL